MATQPFKSCYSHLLLLQRWKVIVNVMSMKESLASFTISTISGVDNDDATELAKKALATGKSINMGDESLEDPMIEQAMSDLEEKALIDPGEAGDREIDTEQTYLLQFDGGARGNPAGIAGAGMALFDRNGKEVWVRHQSAHHLQSPQHYGSSLVFRAFQVRLEVFASHVKQWGRCVWAGRHQLGTRRR